MPRSRSRVARSPVPGHRSRSSAGIDGQHPSLVGTVINGSPADPRHGTLSPVRISCECASPGEFDARHSGRISGRGRASFTSFGSVSLAPGSSINVTVRDGLYQRRAARALGERAASLHFWSSRSARYDLAQPRQFHVTSNSWNRSGQSDVQWMRFKRSSGPGFIMQSGTTDGEPGGGRPFKALQGLAARRTRSRSPMVPPSPRSRLDQEAGEMCS